MYTLSIPQIPPTLASSNRLKDSAAAFDGRIRLHAVHPVRSTPRLEAALTSWGKSRELNVTVIEYDPVMCFPRCTDRAIGFPRDPLGVPQLAPDCSNRRFRWESRPIRRSTEGRIVFLESNFHGRLAFAQSIHSRHLTTGYF